MSSETPAPISWLGLDEVRRGGAAVAEVLARRDGFVIADAENDEDLLSLAEALLLMPKWLPAGSAGLAQAIATARGWHADPVVLAPGQRPTLVICGSHNPVSRAQVEALCRSLRMEPVLVSTEREPESDLLAQWERHGIAVGSLPSEPMAKSEAAVALEALVQGAAQVILRHEIGSFFVTGGATLRRVCEHVGIVSLSPDGEIEPGLVFSRAITESGSVLRVVSRAGGFGDVDLLVRLVGAEAHAR